LKWTVIMLCTVIVFASLSTPFVRSQGTATSVQLTITPLRERKDTYMLDLQDPLSGPYAWDRPHENISSGTPNRCIEAVVAMVDSYYGGNLSQDRIDYHVYDEVLGYTSPIDDLGDPALGVVGVNIVNVLQWALNDASVVRFAGKPDFSQIEAWINSGSPIIRDDGGSLHLFSVIYGYDTNGQMVYVIDPLTGNESKISYDSLEVYIAVVASGTNITPRSDEPTIWMDSDGDGVCDFDEINRFHTNPYNNDTYGLGISDKLAIQYEYMNNSATVPPNQNVSETTGGVFDRQSLNRTGYASTEGPETPDLLWSSNLNDSVTTSPIVADGEVFIGTSGGNLYALDMTTGNTIWTFDCNNPISSSPAFANGTVFFGTENPGTVYSINASTGLPIWAYQVPTGAAVYSSPALVDGEVIAGSSDGDLFCLNQADGHLLWATQLGGGYLSSPAIQNGTVYIACARGVEAVDVLTGTWIWEYATKFFVTSCPAVADGLVFVGTEDDDSLYVLNQSTGNFVWRIWGGGHFTAPAVDSSNQLVIIGSRDYKLYCAEESTGDINWTYINGPNYLSAPTISANGLVYVGTSDGNLICVNETTGEEIWRYNVTNSITSSPTLDDEHVFAATLEGQIYCFGPPYPAITISNITVSSQEIGQGYSTQINATAQNNGDIAETFNVTAYANATAIDTIETTLTNGTSTTMTFTWNTTGFAYGNYTISAYATPPQDNTNTTDTSIPGHWVAVAIPGDLNGDFKVSLADLVLLANAYGTKPGNAKWNPNADIDGNGIVGLSDLVILANHYGQHYP